MTTAVTDWKPLAAAYADRLAATDAITDPAWRTVFATVPRHLFVPAFWALDEHNSPHQLVSGDDPQQRAGWLEAIYSDELLITQWTPQPGPDGRQIRIATSSASQPHVVAVELDRLGLTAGARIREIGTGSGYSTALLCARYGDTHVTSVDIHPDLIDAARDRLAAAGYRPRLRVGDGADPDPDGGPFDAIVATCAVDSIPSAWVDQLAPGGRIVTPATWGGALLVLTKQPDGTVAGRVDREPMWFMPLRPAANEPVPDGYVAELPEPDGVAYRGWTDVDPHDVDDPDFRLWLTLHAPGADLAQVYDEDGTRTGVIVYTATARADADYTPTDNGLWPVTQHAHRIWDTVETAHRAWVRTGRPGRDRLTYTIADDEQTIALDTPDGYAWPVPAAGDTGPGGRAIGRRRPARR